MKLKDVYKKLIKEWQNAHGFQQLIPYLEKKLNIKVGKRIHSGSMSDVFDLGDKVLKITSTPDDAGGLYVAKEHPDYPVPKVYSLYKIDRNEVNKYTYSLTNSLSGKDLWVAVVEKVKPIKASYTQQDILQTWFSTNTTFYPNDIHDQNVGKDSTGRLIYLDPNFEDAETLANKVPVLK